mmetsp:Transcript_16306/g.48671  ORF Transcript_16306/g.48671 Transcript_16306/m.48671 type:complete len:356 (-) Transcript_16306:207-1274(-)
MPGGLDGVRQRLDDLLARGQPGVVRDVLGPRLAGHGHLRPVEEPVVDHELDDARRAADVLHVLHDVLARRLQVGQEGRHVRDALEVVEADGHRRVPHGARHGDQVQHGVRRAPRDHDHADGVLEGALREDVPGLQVQLQEPADGGARALALGELLLGVRGARGGVGQREAQGLDGRRHRVGRVHAAARALARARVARDLQALLLADLVVHVRAVRLEGRDDVQRVARGRLLARADRAAVDHEGRPVEARHGDDDARHVLVAAGNRDQAVVPLRAHDRLHGVRDEVPRLERVAHARRAHGDAVADAHGIEAVADEARLLARLADARAELQEVHITRIAVVPDGAHADLRLREVLGR